jgi:OmpA-OmpF porin, OOP family
MKKVIPAAVATLGLAASGAALAQAPSDNMSMPWTHGFWGHVGVSGGESKFRQDCRFNNVFDCDQRDSAWKAYAGGQINPIVGLEAGYTDFGTMRAAGGDTKAWAIPLTVNIGAPIGPRFNIFGKIGGVYGHTEVGAAPAALVDTGTSTGWGWTGGVGAAFRLTPNFDIRADYDRYRLKFTGAGNQDIDMLSAGVQFRF